MKILVVDDDEMLTRLLTEHLNAMGFVVECAHNGEEALMKIQQCSYKLIFMDVYMPVLDGYEATKAILKQHPDIIIIGITSSVDRLECARFRKIGAMGCLPKPITISKLSAELRALEVIK
jgi:CheY-like chemotaxis protein